MASEHASGLVFAVLLDGAGGGRGVGWDEVRAWEPEQGFLWVHLDYTAPDGQRWMRREAKLDPVLIESLSAEETRPRSLVIGEGLLAILRGINPTQDAEPEDLVSLRLWLDEHRAVTLRNRRLDVPRRLRDAVLAGQGPRDAGELLVELCDRTLAPIGGVLTQLDDEVDDVEERVLSAESYELRSQIGILRRRAISLRRYLAPQRDALTRLYSERVAWIDDLQRQHLREQADRVTRFVEDLDSARDRAAVTQEEINSRLSESMNRTMYILSIVAAIFLPLGLLTGLLGINVGGIPGTESQSAFAIVCVSLFAMAGLLWFVFRRKDLL